MHVDTFFSLQDLKTLKKITRFSGSQSTDYLQRYIKDKLEVTLIGVPQKNVLN